MVLGVYASVAFNFNNKGFAVTKSAGVKIVTNAVAAAGFFAGYYKNKQFNDLKGWGGYMGVSIGKVLKKVSLSASFGVDVSSSTISFSGPAISSSSGFCYPIPYYDLELGYTSIHKQMSWSEARSKELTIKIFGSKLLLKKCDSYYRVRVPSVRKQFKYYSGSKKVKMETY